MKKIRNLLMVGWLCVSFFINVGYCENSQKHVTKEIQVVSGQFVLPGELVTPVGHQKFPVVILVHGSGSANRDEASGPNHPFRDIAYGLAERGIATIRYDKRTLVYPDSATVGKAPLTPHEEVVEDVLSAIDLAKKIPEVDARKIYILGHSLGGMMAPEIARQAKEEAGIIILSGPSRSLADCFFDQLIYVLSQTPQANDTVRINHLKRIVKNVKEAGTENFDPALGILNGMSEEYWSYLRKYNQVEVAKGLKVPVLVMQGERDYQVTMEDFEGWQTGLKSKKNVTYHSYPKLNHLFMEGEGTPGPIEYLRPGKVVDYVLDDMASWIQQNK